MPKATPAASMLALFLLFGAPEVGSSNAFGAGIQEKAYSSDRAPVANGVPRPDHVVIVIEENHSYGEIIGSSFAPYINSLATRGALFTQSYAITHPSQPNYLDLFSGSNQGVS